MTTKEDSILMAAMLLLSALCSTLPVHAQDYDDIIYEINELRKEYHAEPLVYIGDYQQECDDMARSLVTTFRHNRIDAYRGEVISSPFSAEMIVPYFMESRAHKNVLIDKNATRICLSIFFVRRPDSLSQDAYYTVIRTY